MSDKFCAGSFMLHASFACLIGFGGTAAADDQAALAAKSNDQGDRLEILEFDPPLPAELRPGERLTVRVAYELKSNDSAHIFVRPITDGKRTSAYGAHGSEQHQKGKGVVEGWFTFQRPAVIDQVQVTMVTDRAAKVPAIELLAKAAAKWAGDPVVAEPTSSKPQSEMDKLQSRLRDAANLRPEERKSLLQECIDLVKNSERGRTELIFAVNSCRYLEPVDNELAASGYEAFAEIFAASDDSTLSRYVEKMEGAVRRNRLPGNALEVYGATVEGEPFQWKTYQGKVVLVDFWATWCGPCIVELPNVREQYDKYHDQGFDVVGVSLDTDKERLVKFIENRDIPWTNLFSADDEKTGWDHPMATHYGILAIPATILVDQQGNVVSLNARGAALPKLLEQLLAKPRE